MAASEATPQRLVRASAAVKKNSSTTRLYTAKTYPLWFLIPSATLFVIFFLVPTVASFYFAFTRWDLQSATWIGFENFQLFFAEPQLSGGLVHTLIYAVVTSGSKVVLGLPLAVLLTSRIIGRGLVRSIIFFPVLVSTIGVGIAFKALMDPTQGLINVVLKAVGITGPGWLTDPSLVLYSVAIVDIWKGVGLATLIYMAGILAIPREYYEAADVDGTGKFKQFFHITLPLAWPATTTVITLSLIGGLRSFDLIWAMTRGGPGFASDVIASVIYKQYQAGFYGLSTAGNVVLFLLVALIIMPLQWFLTRREVEL
ncbi:MAG TPA: sugar ABC transporter permease [Propionibacteriaceae bacterium]|nr:sugar ABC transporter permease [Propionibacteriaceae bacterium]